ncbi:MAG: EamA family transporter [Alphaproteobacteria bacterium]|nr:EamA family transporter [Alphaproteobacteria bacterium]
MSLWLLFALLARLFWAGTNATDQILSRIHPKHATMAAIILGYLCYLPFAGAILVFAPPFAVTLPYILYCMGGAFCSAVACVPYFRVLQRHEAYDTTPYFELTPVFLIGLSFLLKGEVLDAAQLAGAAIVIVSGFLFSWDFERGHFRLRILAQLSLSCLMWAFYLYCMSQAEALAGVWGATLGFYTCLIGVGFALLLIYRDVSQVIVATFTASKGVSLGLALGTTILEFLGLCSLLLAFHYAPTIGHVAALSGTQPVFSFLLAVVLGKCCSAHYAKMTVDHAMAAKLFLIACIAGGVYLLSSG